MASVVDLKSCKIHPTALTAIKSRFRKASTLSHEFDLLSPLSSRTRLDRPTNTLLVGRITIIPPKLIISSGRIHENVQSIVSKCIAPHAIVPSNRRPAYREASEREGLRIARVVCDNEASGPWVIGLPALHVITLNPGAYRAVEDDTARTKWSTSWLGAEDFVVTEAHAFDSRVEECSVAGIADFIVFDLCAVGLDAVTL